MQGVYAPICLHWIGFYAWLPKPWEIILFDLYMVDDDAKALFDHVCRNPDDIVAEQIKSSS